MFITVKDFYFLSVITLIKIVHWVSSSRLREFVISIIAFTAYTLPRTKRGLMEKNITLAFDGNLSKEQKRKIVKGALREFWQDMLRWLPSREYENEIKGIELFGIEHLYGALKKGMGAILWESSGFGKRIMAKRILHKNGFSIHQVHGANHLGGFLTENSSETWVRRSLIKRFFENCELKFVAEIINLSDSNSLAFTRTLLNLLNQNAILCITGDGKTGQKSISLKFLGCTESFSTGMVSLAKISGATILPMFCIEERSGKISLIIEPPIHTETGVDRVRELENSVAEYAGLLESYIRRYPEQYRNWHLVGVLPEN